MPYRSGVLAVSLLITAPAMAQTDAYATARKAMANQVGVLEYCQAQGFVGSDAVRAQQDAATRLPPSSVATDDMEAIGKQGMLVSPHGEKMTLSGLATAHGSTVEAVCKQMGSAAMQSAAMMKQNSVTSGSMPAMPGGMPAMPGGMPAMPGGMPAMPGGMPGFGTMPGGAVPAPGK